MKLNLTKTEAITIIRQTLQSERVFNHDIEITIEDDTAPPYDIAKDTSLHIRFINEMPINYLTSEKISAVKFVRSLYPGMGLVLAKNLVEQFPYVKQHIQTYHVLPVDKGIYNLDFNRKS